MSGPRPDPPTASRCPRPVQPGTGAGPRATIPHRALSGKIPFGILLRSANTHEQTTEQYNQPTILPLRRQGTLTYPTESP